MTKSTCAAATALTLSLAAPLPAFAQPVEGGGVNDEIIVTAQKREEILQDVPISISVVGGEQLREPGAAQLVDFGNYVPGLQVDSLGTPGQATLSLRGIAPVGPSQTVGIYVDDTPVGSSSIYARSVSFALDLLPYDIQRIEILRGPQGTLYGASSIGGLLKYVTTSPDLQDLTGRAGVEAFDIAHGGELGHAVQGLISAPLIPGKLAVSASGAYRRSPGYVDNVQTGERDQNDHDQFGGRVSLLWQPSDGFSARLSALYQEVESDNNAQVVEDLATGRRIGDGLSNNNFIDETFRRKLEYYSATLNYDLGFATATSATSYSKSAIVQVQDGSRVFGVLFPLLTGGAIPAGITPFRIELDLEKFTQELRLTSPSDERFEWLLGAFYTHEKSGNEQLVNSFTMAGEPIAPLDPLAIASIPSRFREYALFGNSTFKFSDRFHLTGGVRYAKNKQRFRQISGGAILPAVEQAGRSSEGVFTFSVSPQFHVNDNTMIYARVASGYRPGGPNVASPGVPPTVDSDTLTSYELGIKSNVSRTLALEFAAFTLDWDDIQLARLFGGISGLANAGAARSRGVEGSVIWQPVRGLRLGLNGAYIDAELTSDSPEGVIGLDGDRLPNIPRWSGSATADYSFDVGANRARVGLGVRHTGRRISELESNPDAVPAAAYTALDLNGEITLTTQLTLRAYVRNLTDSDGDVTRSLATDGIGRPYQFTVTPLQPRTIGLAAELSF